MVYIKKILYICPYQIIQIMKNLLSYHENSYFNTEDTYLFHNNLNNLILTKVHLYNGNWYSNHNNYKMISVSCINYKELHGTEVNLIETDFKGKLCDLDKTLLPYDVGVMWKINGHIKGGIPTFWNNINNLKEAN